MGFWTLLEVASMPILQVFIISLLGFFMATKHLNLLPTDTRKSLNKIVFMVFTPSLMFAGVAKTITFQDIISWWFLPVNILLSFLIGGILGWIVVKILRPEPYLEGLVIAACSSGNLGNLLLTIVPAMCDGDGSLFGDHDTCGSIALSYASFSMAVGGICVWTYTYYLIQSSSKKLEPAAEGVSNEPNLDLETTSETPLLRREDREQPTKPNQEEENQTFRPQESNSKNNGEQQQSCYKVVRFLQQILKDLVGLPALAVIVRFIFKPATTFLKKFKFVDSAPLRAIQDSIQLVGDGATPCIMLILGGNLTRGIWSSRIKPWIVIAVIVVRYLLLPAIGIGIVKAADILGFLSPDPLYHFVLLIQFALPPDMNIGTMTQLFEVGQEECSVLFFWTYLAAVLSLTLWSTVFIWILS